MRKTVCALFACFMMLALTGCQEEKTVTMSMADYDGQHEIIIDVKGDDVQKITQTSKLEIEGYSESQINDIVSDLEAEHESLTDGLTFSVKYEGSTLIKTYTLNATDEDAIEAANGYGFFNFTVGTKKITLKSYLESMKSEGFNIVEEKKK